MGGLTYDTIEIISLDFCHYQQVFLSWLLQWFSENFKTLNISKMICDILSFLAILSRLSNDLSIFFLESMSSLIISLSLPSWWWLSKQLIGISDRAPSYAILSNDYWISSPANFGFLLSINFKELLYTLKFLLCASIRFSKLKHLILQY